jgi:tripartite-type tricarboxylate transporter receptor subunit TctC
VLAQQRYPTKPIRVLTPFAPGGGTDILARLMSPPLMEAFGQPIVVDNRPGGGGSVGATIAARSEPDGYTFIIVSGSYGANAALHDLPFDPVDGIQPVILIGTTCLLVTMYPAIPIKTIPELISAARASPGKYNFGSAGTGGLGHLAQELFRLETNVNITHVPYKGTGPVMNALLAGEIQSSFSSLVPSIPHVKAGRLRAVAVTTPKRSRALPDVPTIGESVPGYEVTHWYGMWAPRGVPADIVLRWNREMAKLLQSEGMQKWLTAEGLEAAGGAPAEFQSRIRTDVEKWRKVVKEANIVIAK